MNNIKELFVDDFGDGYYACDYIGGIHHCDACVIVGAIIPGVKSKRVIAKTSRHLHIESYRIFADTEQNCNTCKYLERIKQPKNAAGLIIGGCKSPRSQKEVVSIVIICYL